MNKAVPFFALIMASVATYGQAMNDTLFIARSIENAKLLYHQTLRGESPLYIGSDYAEYVPLADEHPFYISNDWIEGDLFYDDFLYRHVPLQYDISAQKLITEHLTSAKKIQVVSEKIGYFKIQDHTFIWLPEHVTRTFNEPSGFYDLLADGTAKLYARRIKNIQRNVVAGKLEATFEEVSKYFVEKDGKFYSVKSKGSILDVFSERKSELAKSIKRNKIKFSSSNRERALIETVKLYNIPAAKQ